MEDDQTAKGQYLRLSEKREPYLRRAYTASKLTIPALLPEREDDFGTTRHQDLPTPYQGVGARGVNNLASKLLLTVLPANQPFFRLQVDKSRLGELGGDADITEEIEQSLVRMESRIMQEIEALALRVPTFELLMHLIVTGNVLTYLPDDENRLRVFHMDTFQVQRDPMGSLFEVITKEVLSPATLGPDLRAMLQDAGNRDNDSQIIPLYTWCRREGDKWMAHQELGHSSMYIPDSEGEWTTESFPYNALRLRTVAGEAWGRGLVEEYEGDLRSLEGLTRAIVEGAAASVRLLFLVNPDGLTREVDLARKPNGGFARGRADDVTTLQADKQADLSVAASIAERIEDRLSRAFLLNTGVTRQAERVTAEEIRFVAQELEDTLGGVYSILTQDFQLPLVHRLMDRLKRKRQLPALPKDLVTPTIVTGLDALGRGHDFNKLQLSIGAIVQLLGPEIAARYIVPSNTITRLFNSTGVQTEGMVRTEEEVQQQLQQQQISDTIQASVPTVAGNLTPRQ